MTPVEPTNPHSDPDRTYVHVVVARNQPEYLPLPTCQALGDPQGPVVTEWLLSEEELDRVAETRRIRITMLCHGSPVTPILPEIVPPSELRRA